MGGGESSRKMYEMKLEGTFRKPLARQIREGVELEMSQATIVMNSKSEWNNSRIPRIIIETGETIKEDQESGVGRASTDRKTVERESRRKEVNKSVAPKRKQHTESKQPAPKKRREDSKTSN